MKYCKNCGNQLFDEAIVCPKCCQSVIPNHKIIIKRENQFYVGKMVYKVKVDGQEEYLIDNGEALELELPSGMHQLYFHYSFRSKTVNIDLEKDVTLVLSWDRFTGGISVYEV